MAVSRWDEIRTIQINTAHGVWRVRFYRLVIYTVEGGAVIIPIGIYVSRKLRVHGEVKCWSETAWLWN